MSQEKVDLMNPRFMSREMYRDSNIRSPGAENVAFVESHSSLPHRGMLAVPQYSLERYGPSNLPHEGRHVQQHTKILPGVDPGFFYHSSPLRFRNTLEAPGGGVVTTGNREILSYEDAKGLHNQFNPLEVDAALSEMATIEAAGDPSFQKYLYAYGDRIKGPDGKTRIVDQQRIADSYRRVWSKMPEWAKDQYRATIGVGGVAAPSIGALQPETENQ
jgi:hypothetical protein